MTQQLLNTLSAKSTDELKDYVSNMNNGYTQEAVEIAIHILKERGEDVDKLLRAAQVSICETCQQRKQTSAGLICTLSDKKADFIGSCPNYEPDESAVAEVERNTQINSEWGGMMNFYRFVLCTGAVVTLVMTFVGINFANGVLLTLCDIVMMLAYAALCLYTVLAFTQRLPNAVTLGKIQNYSLIAMNSLGIFFNVIEGNHVQDGYTATYRLVPSLIWAAIFLSYLYSNEQIKTIYPKKSRHLLKYDKPIMWSIFGLIITLFFAGIVELAIKEINNPINQLTEYIEYQNSNIEVEPSANQYIIGCELKDNVVVMRLHSNTYKNADISSIYMDFMPIFSKELAMFYPNELDITLIQHCAGANYGISIEWYDSNDEYTYSFSFSPDDITKIVSGTTYSTSKKVWSEFLIAWNKQCPIAYIQEDLIYTNAEVKGNEAIINLVFKGWTASDLHDITNEYLKNYLTDIFDDLVDQYITLAMLNNLDIYFRFTSDSSLFWQEDVIFTPEEYNK